MSRGALAAAATSVVVGLAGAGCGDQAQRGALAWTRPPQVFTPRDLPRDRIAIGQIRNTSNHAVRLEANTLRVRDSQGRLLESSAGFTASYAHGLFGAFQRPSAEPLRELVRLGRLVFLNPGDTSPVFAAWRMPVGAHGPANLDYGSGRLRIPSDTRPTAP